MSIKDVIVSAGARTTLKQSWSISWPITLIMFYEFLIGLTDVFIAGRFGKEVQAAYGLAFQLYFVFIIIGIALSMGSVSIIARLFPSGKSEEFNAVVNTSLLVSIVSGAVFALIGCLFSEQFFSLFRISDAVRSAAQPLFRIYAIGFIFDYILINTNGTLRACEMVKRSLVTMSVVCLINVLLDYILALHTPLRAQGIAVATVISLGVGCLINYFPMKIVAGRRPLFSWHALRRICKIGWPSGALQVLWQLGAIALFSIVSLLPFGSIETMAAFTNGLKIESAIFLPAFAFNMANAVIVGNLLGKGDKNGAFTAGIVTAGIGVAIITALSVLVMINAPVIARALSNDTAVIKESMNYIYIALLLEPVMAWGVILGGGLNGAGDTKGVMTIITLSIWLVRIPISYMLGIFLSWGAASIWWTMNLSIIVQTVFITRRFYAKRWADQPAL